MDGCQPVLSRASVCEHVCVCVSGGGLQLHLPLHIVLKLLSSASLCFPPLVLCSSVLTSFKLLIVAGPFLTESWESSYIQGSSKLYVLVWRKWQPLPCQSIYSEGSFFMYLYVILPFVTTCKRKYLF